MRDKQENELTQILSQSEGAMAVYDNADLNIAFVNQGMLHMWGRDECILGKTFGDVFPDFTEQGFTTILKNVWRTGETYRATDYPADITIEGVRETKYFDFVYQAVLNETGKTRAIIHIATDVSDRRSVLKTVEEQDVLINFNNELEVLTNTLSHDLRNPLSLAKMGVQYLKNHPELSSAEKNRWKTLVLDAISNVDNIITYTVQLNRARLYQYSNECHIMEDMIRKICLECQLLYSGEAHCLFKTEALAPLYGDKGVLYQIFMNIIGNAVKYSSTVSDPAIRIESKQIEGYTVYHIEDNGIGIPQKDMPHIFGQFSRGSNTQGHSGTGVGLCLVKKIIERIGGKIEISSTQGKGTKVALYFLQPKNQQKMCEDKLND